MSDSNRLFSPLSRHRLVPIVTVLLLAVVVSCGNRTTLPADKAAFRLETLGGEELGPPDFPDQIVVVDFWATWCTPCRAQAEILEQLHSEYADRGVQFLAVDVAEERETVEKFVQSNPFPYPVLLDPDDRLSAEIGLLALPTVMVIDREGSVIYFEPGVVGKDRLEKLLQDGGAPA